MYKIEKGIPVPFGKGRYPFYDMQVGDSFFAEGKEPHKVASAAYQFSRKKALGAKYTARTEGTGTRIWRIV
jgi:hypothetical protein|tara:strand:+ start:3767 stop:3979 length:213 start_codon:yes stop_codon:yes gene_type:complete